MNFILDSAEFRADNMQNLCEFFAEREKTSRWYTDEDGTRASDVRFKPIDAEPILVGAAVTKLKEDRLIKFEASEEAYGDTMYCPDYGCEGSTQMMLVKDRLYPVGASAINGAIDRAGIRTEGWEKLKKYSPAALSEVLNLCAKATTGNLSILVQDEKVRAVNSGRYAICPMSDVAKLTEEWIAAEYPKAVFKSSYVCHDFATWVVDLSAYTKNVLGQFQPIIDAGFVPALIVRTSNTGKSSVSLRPALMIGNSAFGLTSIDAPHIAGGNASERQAKMYAAVKENFKQVFPSLEKSTEEIVKLQNVSVSNATNALLRGMKSIGLPKEQAHEAAEMFNALFGMNATAYDCYMTVVDVFTFIVRDFPMNERKQFAAADAMARAVKIRWADLGNIPGDFAW